MFRTEVVEKNHNTHFVFYNSPLPPPENRAVYEIMWKKYCRAVQSTDDNMAHAHCLLITYGCKHTLRIYNTYCFFYCSNCCKDAPQCYVIRTLPVLSNFSTALSHSCVSVFHIHNIPSRLLSCRILGVQK